MPCLGCVSTDLMCVQEKEEEMYRHLSDGVHGDFVTDEWSRKAIRSKLKMDTVSFVTKQLAIPREREKEKEKEREGKKESEKEINSLKGELQVRLVLSIIVCDYIRCYIKWNIFSHQLTIYNMEK